jgi:hypothetical protein
MNRGRSFGSGDEGGQGADAGALPFQETEDDGSCTQCGAEAPLNGAELCEECHDEEQAELIQSWAEGHT